MLAQGDNTKDPSVLDVMKNIIKLRDKKPGNVYLGLVHRLDRPTSGVMVLAKTSKALSRLNKQFVDKTTSKTYWAVVSGEAADKSTRLSHYLLKARYPNIDIAYIQSNIEGELIDALHAEGFSTDGIILNAGAYTHTSVGIGDAIKAIETPVVEVHISNTFSREDFRHTSFITPNARGLILGFGLDVYRLAIESFTAK